MLVRRIVLGYQATRLFPSSTWHSNYFYLAAASVAYCGLTNQSIERIRNYRIHAQCLFFKKCVLCRGRIIRKFSGSPNWKSLTDFRFRSYLTRGSQDNKGARTRRNWSTAYGWVPRARVSIRLVSVRLKSWMILPVCVAICTAVTSFSRHPDLWARFGVFLMWTVFCKLSSVWMAMNSYVSTHYRCNLLPCTGINYRCTVIIHQVENKCYDI